MSTPTRGPRLALIGFGFALLSSVATFSAAQSITEFSVPTPMPTDLYSICAGPDGAIWFGEARTAKAGRITMDGVITEFSTEHSPPYQMAAGPDGNIWFANGGVGRLTPAGEYTQFAIPDISDGDGANVIDITAGPDGALWFADGAHRIGRITPDGDVTMYPTPTTARVGPYAIALGSDGNLWYADEDENVIGRVTPAGVITTFPVPDSGPFDIAAGPDGALWFGRMDGGGGVGRITTSGDVTTFPGFFVWHLTAGPDGNIWFTDPDTSVGRITPAGVVTLFEIGPDTVPDAIVGGADGNIWFTERGSNKIGRLNLRNARLVERPAPERRTPVEHPPRD